MRSGRGADPVADAALEQGAERGCGSGGRYYERNAAMPSLDDCNACWCGGNDHIVCTQMQCLKAPLVQFAPGSPTLDTDSKTMLDEAVELLKAAQDIRVHVIGHAAEGETAADKLSLRRAHAVRDYLIKAGIDPKRLQVSGLGSTQPFGTEPANDRRVELKPEPGPPQ